MKLDPILRKMLAVGIIALSVGMNIIPSTARDERATLALPKLRGEILYVGGSGPGNFSMIQDAINHSFDGDTIFVYSGVYYGRLKVTKAISLIGESKNSTIIDAKTSNEGILISIQSNGITISGFTLRFNGDWGYPRCIISNSYPHESGENITISNNIFYINISQGIWLIDYDFCVITQNIFYANYGDGIDLDMGNECVITDNMIENASTGISLTGVVNSTISNNSILMNEMGLLLEHSDFNIVSSNSFLNNTHGISIDGSENNTILLNDIENPMGAHWIPPGYIGIQVFGGSFWNAIEKNFIRRFMIGIFLQETYYTIISMNTLMDNTVHARFLNTGPRSHNIWSWNYWGRSRILPKPIFGVKDIYRAFPRFLEFDWHPAQKPYNIHDLRCKT